MAQEYNIYLRKRLTEFDVIIKNLPYRDGLIMYNKMYLDAMVNYLCLQRFIIGESDANLRTEIDDLLERVFNTFQNKVEIDLDVELAAGKPISGQSDLVFTTSPFEMGEETYEVFQNLTKLTTSALQYDLAKSIGSGRSDLIFHTLTADLHGLRRAHHQQDRCPAVFRLRHGEGRRVRAHAQPEAGDFSHLRQDRRGRGRVVRVAARAGRRLEKGVIIAG